MKIRGVYNSCKSFERSTYSGIHLNKNNKLVLRCASSFKTIKKHELHKNIFFNFILIEIFRERMIPLSGQMSSDYTVAMNMNLKILKFII